MSPPRKLGRMITRRHLLAVAAAPLLPQFGSSPDRQSSRPPKRRLEVLDTTMAVVDLNPAGTPLTFVFLHGNPTSSYLWRGIMPAVAPLGRAVAPDLIGMGDSAKLSPSGADRYTIVEHLRYLDALFDQLRLGDRIVLVLHDWGGMLGFDWARRNAARVAGIAHMETVMDGLSTATAPPQAVEFFRRYRRAEGERAVLTENQFVEQVLLRGLSDRLTDADRAEYRRPFVNAGEDRRPTLTFPRQIPIDGDPTEVSEVIRAARSWLDHTAIPKLFINAEPGALIASPGRKAICRAWPNTTEVTVAAAHYVPEERPREVADSISAWAARLR